MHRQGVLRGAHWFVMYTTFFAILSLVYYAVENPDSPSTANMIKEATEGKEILAGLTKRSLSADRCSHLLQGLFSHLPEKLRGRPPSLPSSAQAKKRQAQSKSPLSTQQRALLSTPHLPGSGSTNSNRSTPPLIQRASTFPHHPQQSAWKRMSGALPAGQTLQQNEIWRRSSFEPYNASPNTQSRHMTPDSNSTSSYPSQPQQQSVNYNPSSYSNSIPDLTASMFPSDNPFAYPAQSMTTFDQAAFDQSKIYQINTGVNDNNSNSGNTSNPAGFNPNNIYSASPSASSSSQHPYDNIEVQVFGPLPPYMMGQQPQPQPPQPQQQREAQSTPKRGIQSNMMMGNPEYPVHRPQKHQQQPQGLGLQHQQSPLPHSHGQPQSHSHTHSLQHAQMQIEPGEQWIHQQQNLDEMFGEGWRGAWMEGGGFGGAMHQ